MQNVQTLTEHEIKDMFSTFEVTNITTKIEEASDGSFKQFVWIDIKRGMIAGSELNRVAKAGYEVILILAKKKDLIRLVLRKDLTSQVIEQEIAQ